jgi:hypothetical protein
MVALPLHLVHLPHLEQQALDALEGCVIAA